MSKSGKNYARRLAWLGLLLALLPAALRAQNAPVYRPIIHNIHATADAR